MVADVEAIQAFFQDIDQDRMTVPQVENAAVGMQVEKFFRAILVVKKRAAALAHDEIHPELPEKSHFTGGNMGFEGIDGIFSVHMGMFPLCLDGRHRRCRQGDPIPGCPHPETISHLP
jgi:hypothetical protein